MYLQSDKGAKAMKEKTIAWLENNQQNGAFENQPEDDMDFNVLSEDEINWYYQNWVLEEEKEQN